VDHLPHLPLLGLLHQPLQGLYRLLQPDLLLQHLLLLPTGGQLTKVALLVMLGEMILRQRHDHRHQLRHALLL
jgi:hypothetical protein